MSLTVSADVYALLQSSTLAAVQSQLLASPGAIGGTTPSTGAFTTLSATGGATIGDIRISSGRTIDTQSGNGPILGGIQPTSIGTSLVIGTNAAADTILIRDAANTLAMRNGTNAQTFRAYNTYTDASNYERGGFEWNTNFFYVGTQNAGTGAQRATVLYGSAVNLNTGTIGGGSTRWQINSTGHFLAGTDNTYNIGASGNDPKLVRAYTLLSKPVAFASLPTAAEGMIAAVSDSSTATWGATVTGGGANHVLAYYNGTNWTVMAK